MTQGRWGFSECSTKHLGMSLPSEDWRGHRQQMYHLEDTHIHIVLVKVPFVKHLKRKPTAFGQFYLRKWCRMPRRPLVWEEIPVQSGLQNFNYNVFSRGYQDSGITSSQERLIGCQAVWLSLSSPFPVWMVPILTVGVHVPCIVCWHSAFGQKAL